MKRFLLSLICVIGTGYGVLAQSQTAPVPTVEIIRTEAVKFDGEAASQMRVWEMQSADAGEVTIQLVTITAGESKPICEKNLNWRNKSVSAKWKLYLLLAGRKQKGTTTMLQPSLGMQLQENDPEISYSAQWPNPPIPVAGGTFTRSQWMSGQCNSPQCPNRNLFWRVWRWENSTAFFVGRSCPCRFAARIAGRGKVPCDSSHLGAARYCGEKS